MPQLSPMYWNLFLVLNLTTLLILVSYYNFSSITNYMYNNKNLNVHINMNIDKLNYIW